MRREGSLFQQVQVLPRLKYATELARGFVFELAPDVPSGRVAPAFIEIYDTPWMADQVAP